MSAYYNILLLRDSLPQGSNGVSSDWSSSKYVCPNYYSDVCKLVLDTSAKCWKDLEPSVELSFTNYLLALYSSLQPHCSGLQYPR